MKILREGCGTFVSVNNLKSTLEQTITDLEKITDSELTNEAEIRIKTLTEITDMLDELNKI